MGREAMQPVELTELTGPDATSPDAAGSGERAEADARRRWSRRRRWALAVAAALVVGLVSTQAVLDARERAHLAHLATIPGVLAPVDASVGTLWSTNDESKIALLSGAPAGDLRISGYIDPAGERAVQAIRARTGERAWSTVLRAADPAAPAQGTALGPSCSLTGPAEAPGKVVCLVTDAAYVTDDTGARTPVAPTYARVVVLDPPTGTQQGQSDAPTSAQLGALDAATGATLWEQPLAVSAFSSLVTDGRSILALETVSAGRLSLVAFAPEDGHRRWASPLPLGVDLSLIHISEPTRLGMISYA